MDPVTDSGGRVTRSLRKRISSVDGENSSRPGTPVPSKLTAITEISSPSRPTRMTRRNSTTGVATPVKRAGTPSLIAESTETLTPARRTTRRRSISTNEGEETPQPIKAPVFEAVAEEITTTTVKSTTTRVTRLQSKSPEHLETFTPAKPSNAKSPENISSGDKKSAKTKSLKRRKPGPKSKTRLSLDEDEDLSDVEVIVAEKEDTKENQSIANANIVDLLDCDDDTRQSGINNGMENEKTSNIQITSVTNVNDKMIVIETVQEHLNLDQAQLSNEEMAKESDPLAPTKKIDSNVSKTNIKSQVDEKNITIIDLMDCDDESQELPEKKVTSISSKSPKIKLSESLLDNDKNTESNAEEIGNILAVDETDEMPKEPETEELPLKDSPTIVINETLLNNYPSEKNDLNIKEIDLNESKIRRSPRRSLKDKVNLEEIDLNASKIKESPRKSLQDKVNLEDSKLDKQNEIPNDPNSIKDLKDSTMEMEMEKSADPQKDMASELTQRKSTAVITEVINITQTLTSPSQDKSSNKVEFKRSPRLAAKKLADLIVSKTDKKNITIIDLMDCDDEPQKMPEENQMNSTSKDSPKSERDNDKKSNETVQNENIFEIDDDVNESISEDISTMDSLIVIDETMFNKTVSEEITHTNEELKASETTENIELQEEKDSTENIEQQEEKESTESIEQQEEKESLTELDDQNGIMVLKTTENNIQQEENNRQQEENKIQQEENNIQQEENNIQQKEKDNLPLIDDQTESMNLNPTDLNVKKGLEDMPIQTLASKTTTPRKSTATIIEVININIPLPTTPVVTSKKVEFNSSPLRDNSVKVYPKTPAMIKSKRFFEMQSLRDENNSTTGDITEEKGPQDENNPTSGDITEEKGPQDENNPTSGDITEEGPQDEICEMEVDEDEVKEAPEEQKIEIKEKNSPSQESENTTKGLNELPEQEYKTKQLEELDDVTVTTNDEKSNAQVTEIVEKATSSPKKDVENQLKWINPSVTGFTNECKLDEVVTPVKPPEKSAAINDNEEKTLTPKKRNAILFSSDSNDEEENPKDDDEEEVELAPGEKPYKKNTFHDDEAMEMEDYNSGDSMDSEERREIIENEIPIDGESIGSATTDDEHDDDDHDEGEDSENDSFIVSDNDVEENEVTDSDDEGETVDKMDDRKKKKSYKRIQHPTESSSSSDDMDKDEMEKEIKLKMNSSSQKADKNEFDTSKLSDTALRLQASAESESEEVEENKADVSRKDILRKLNQSDRFNKSVRDLNPEVDTSPVENNEEQNRSMKLSSKDIEAKFSESENDSEEDMEEKNENEGDEDEEEEAEEDQEDEKSSNDEDSSLDENIKENKRKHKREKGSESQLGEVSVTTESDGDKENNNKNRRSSLSSNRLPGGGSGLSVSFGNFKKANKNNTERKDWQRSFTIGVSVKGTDLDTLVTENKTAIESSSSSSPSPTFSNDEENENLSSDDVHDLEKIRHMPLPLGNPLVRTRRQSLALPSNPDKDICSSPYGGAGGAGPSKKSKRKSLGLLSSNEFNPSQSFIETIEMRKHEFVRNSAKRKRLSKSFCGTADTLDNSVIDIDVAHLHKRSRLAMDNSNLENYHDSLENIAACKLSSKPTTSSTPCEKVAKKDSNNNVQRILSRCDEILEAANRAKLEDKINNKKSKVKLPKKNRKKILAKQMKHNDKIKAAALAQALKAADEVIQGKKIQQHLRTGNLDEEHEEDSKRISSDVLEEIAENVVKKNNQRDVPSTKMRAAHVATTVTTSGNFVEMPQTPEKKKKKKRAEIIQLPTGKMCVEPITPKQRSVLACNGTEFHESPVTPFAVGFKVRQMPSDDHCRKQASTLKDRKRKRNFDDQPMHSLPQPQWTQSGLFIEEEISTMRRIARSEASQLSGPRKLRKLAKANEEQNAYSNFKQNALMRGDIKRCTSREILQLKERRQMQN